MRRWGALLGIVLAAASSQGGEPAVPSQDLARAIQAAIRELAREEPGPTIQESVDFLMAHSVEAIEPIRQARKSAEGIQLVRLVSVLETLERQYRQRKDRPGSLRAILLAEPTLRLLLALVWLILVFVLVKAFRDHAMPHLEGYLRSREVHVDPKTLRGIERLVAGLTILVGVNLCVVLFVMQGLPVPDETRAYYNHVRSQVFNGLFFLALGYGFLKMVDVLFDSAKKRLEREGTALDQRLLLLGRHGVKGALVLGTLLLVLENLALEVRFLHLAFGILGVALALASREALANVFGAISVVAGRSFQVGERVCVDGLDGYVESIGIQSTRLRTQDGTLATIPNSRVASAVVTNLTRRPHTRQAFSLYLVCEAAPERVERAIEIVREILSKDEAVQDFWVHLVGVAPQGVELQASLWLRSTEPRRVREDLEAVHLEVKRRFDAEGVTPLLARVPRA